MNQETGQEIHNLYRLRWQVELLFKALKSKLSMGEIKDKNEHKAMMMIYGKLIVTVLGLMFISFIDDEKNEISLYKAMSYCKEMIGRIYNDLRKGLVKSLEKFLLKLQKFAQKSRRKNRPSTVQICGL